jgi:hypothetical protein
LDFGYLEGVFEQITTTEKVNRLEEDLPVRVDPLLILAQRLTSTEYSGRSIQVECLEVADKKWHLLEEDVLNLCLIESVL